MTNSAKQIIGEFTKQVWGGRKNDTASPVETVPFDATATILSMSYEKLLKIKDNDETSDEIGLASVPWDGPHEVAIVVAICGFFGVEELSDITKKQFDDAKQSFVPPAANETKTFTVVGIYAETMQRHTAHIKAASADLAEHKYRANQLAKGHEMFVAGVFEGEHKCQDTTTYADECKGPEPEVAGRARARPK